jgi:hypothetical protein
LRTRAGCCKHRAAEPQDEYCAGHCAFRLAPRTQIKSAEQCAGVIARKS